MSQYRGGSILCNQAEKERIARFSARLWYHRGENFSCIINKNQTSLTYGTGIVTSSTNVTQGERERSRRGNYAHDGIVHLHLLGVRKFYGILRENVDSDIREDIYLIKVYDRRSSQFQRVSPQRRPPEIISGIDPRDRKYESV